MNKIDPSAFNELPKSKKEKPVFSDEYKKIQNEADKNIELNRQKEREAYFKAQLFIARSTDKDPIIILIELIRNSKDEEEAKLILKNNINLLLKDEEIRYLINHYNEGTVNNEFQNEKTKVLNR